MTIKKLTNNQQVIILAGSIIDGTGAKPKDRQAIIIDNQKIKKVIPQQQLARSSKLSTYKRINLNDYTILPGLIDSHVHLALDGIDFKKVTDEWNSRSKTKARVTKELKNTLKNGVVAVRDGGDRAQIGLTAKQMIEKKEVFGPEVVTTNYALYKEEHYGSFLGPGIESKDEIKEEIINLHQSDIDQLKVLTSGIISFSEYSKVGAVQFSIEELRYIVNLAHEHGLRVMAHASSEEAVQNCIQAEVDTLEHGYFLSKKSLHKLAEKEIPWIPTVVPVANQFNDKELYSKEELAIIKQSYELQLKMIDKATELGVKLGIGTDAGAYQVQHGLSYFRELELFNQTSLSPLEIIKIATNNNAEIIGLDYKLGSIESNKKSELIGVKGDPLKDLSLLDNPEIIIHAA